jgi:hypothetical protein
MESRGKESFPLFDKEGGRGSYSINESFTTVRLTAKKEKMIYNLLILLNIFFGAF